MRPSPERTASLDAALRAHERRLWGLCYRMTGSAADADDLVQETFARALATPPRLDAPIAPWLTRVAVNLAVDALRRRRRTPYAGPWLPAPIETGEDAAELAGAVEPASTERRYDLLESVTFAFLLALEALTPQQRAVLLLRDVLDYSVREAADALGLSEANVKTSHLRARRAMAAYDAARTVPTRAAQERHRAALEALMGALLARDVAAVEELLAAEVRHRSDGGGVFVASRLAVRGPAKVAAFLLKLLAVRGPPDEAEVRMINGFPGVLVRYRAPSHAHDAPLFVVGLELGPGDRIVEMYSVLATPKLSGLARRRA